MSRVHSTSIKRATESRLRSRDRAPREIARTIERMAAPTPPLLVKLAGKVVQLPNELALSLVRRRKVTLVANPKAQVDLILTDDDLDEAGIDLWADEFVTVA